MLRYLKYSPQPAVPHLQLKLCLAAGRAGTWKRTPPNNTVRTDHSLSGTLKVHKIENFFGSEFKFYTISLLVMLKY